MNLKELGENIGLEEDEYRELVELFLDTGTADYDRMKTAFVTGDAQQVALRAHTLNGAAGNLGIINIHKVAKRIEHAAGDNRLDSVSKDVDSLEELFKEIAGIIGG